MTGQRRPSTDERLRQIVELRLVFAGLEPPSRDRIWRVARELRLELDDSIPKLPAARALGISVRALDEYVATGVIPTLRRPGADRSQVLTDAILDLLEEVTALRRKGATSGAVETAVDRLREEGRLHRKLRPNTSPAELRHVYRTTTPIERLRIAAELSYVQTRLAASGEER